MRNRDVAGWLEVHAPLRAAGASSYGLAPRQLPRTGSARKTWDALVIGAGFFGLEIALELHRLGLERILIAEREPAIMRRASYVNQARVHNGYHYPRAIATAERSRVNFQTFVNEYADAVVPGMESVYAVARGSKISAAQFETFCSMLGAPCRAAPRRITDLFDPTMIEAAFLTREFAFDSARLAKRLGAAVKAAGVTLRLGAAATVLGGDATGSDVDVGGTLHRTAYLFNCTYAAIEFSGVRLRSEIKKELAELVLLAPPPELRYVGITVMDGPFFSTMPFPAAGLHSLSHVRYTPHESYSGNRREPLRPNRSNRHAMIRDSQRYLPCLAHAHIVGSIFDIKATLVQNEDDDGRPILIERSAELPRVFSVLGAKIDNIYDVKRFLRDQIWN